MSLGSVSSDVDPSDPQQQAVAKASEAGVINVISAGNSVLPGRLGMVIRSIIPGQVNSVLLALQGLRQML